MYHWASRRIEAHVKICVLALLIQRIVERECGKSWHHIRRELEQVQVTEFFHLNFRVLMRNELSPEAINLLKSLKIKQPKRVIDLLEKTEALKLQTPVLRNMIIKRVSGEGKSTIGFVYS